MEKCPQCESILRIGATYHTYENDDTPYKQTIGFINLPMHCVNPQCVNFAGNNLNEPKHTVTVIKNQLH